MNPAADFRVAVFGAAHLDRLIRTPGEARLGVSNPGSVSETPGGVGFNIARSLALLGVHVRIASRIGADTAGDSVAAAARRLGIETSGLYRSPNFGTGSYHAIIDGAGSLVIGIADAAIYDEITPERLEAPVTAARECQLWLVDANLPDAALQFIARAAGRPPLAACTVSPEKAVRLIPILAGLDILFCNRSEAMALTGAADTPAIERLAEALIGLGVKAGVVTDGDAPVAAWSGETIRRLPPLTAARIVSVNGAGDALAAGTCYGLALDLPFLDAVPWGLAAAVAKIEAPEPVRPDLTAAMLAERLGNPDGRPARPRLTLVNPGSDRP